MAQARPYYADRSLSAAFYDVVTAADQRLAGDIDIYARLAPPEGRVLELGAGAGRIAFALAGQGFTVTGIEIAPAMLVQAQTKRSALDEETAARVTLRRGDMTALDLKASFDLVICPYFTLAHVPAGAAWRNTFATAARHLQPGGIAAFHLPLRAVMSSPGPGNPDLPVLDEPLDSGGRLQLYVRERTFRDAIGRLDQVIEYVERGPDGQVLRRSPERLTYYLTDPEPLAAEAGLVRRPDPVELGGVGEIWVFQKA
jgi:SAM-dependent methyltransferase